MYTSGPDFFLLEMLNVDGLRLTKKCYDLFQDAVLAVYNVPRKDFGSMVRSASIFDAKIESEIKDTTEMDTWTTMRVERKQCSTTRRLKAESGSPYKNWLISTSLHDATVMMRATHAIYDIIHADIWYDFKIQPAKTKEVAPYWIVEVRENSRAAKLSMLEDAGIVTELAHLILEYSFPTSARIAIQTKGRAKSRVTRNPVIGLAWEPHVDHWVGEKKPTTLKPQRVAYASKRIAAMQRRAHRAPDV